MSTSIFNSKLFGSAPTVGEGVQIEYSFRLLSALLYEWCSYTGEGHLLAIYFDKFGGISFRLWNSLHRLQGDGSEDNVDHIRFRAPFEEIPGKHGRGPGRRDYKSGKDVSYLLDIAYEFEADGPTYFSVEPPNEAPNNPKHPKTIIKPAIPPQALLSSFNPLEKHYAQRLQSAIAHLDADEIRALGTHSSHLLMLKDVRKEFGDIRRKKLDRQLLESMRDGRPFLLLAEEISQYLDEAVRKSDKNRVAYATGFEKLRQEFRGEPTLLEAFLACQESADRIWDKSDQFVDLAGKAARAFAFSRYLRALGFYGENPDRRPPKSKGQARQYLDDWNKGCVSIGNLGLGGFPTDVEAAFNRNGSVKDGCQKAVAREFEFLLG